MSNRIKLTVATMAVAAVGLAGCTSVTEPDRVGLYYFVGDLEGNKFDHCTTPSETDDMTFNDEIIYLPIDLRGWEISEAKSADSNELTTVSTKPEDNQPSGVQVKVSSKTSFMLNTFCGTPDKDGKTDGGVARKFWETIGRRDDARGSDDGGGKVTDGWNAMLNRVMAPALKTASQNVLRTYGADALVGNIGGIRADAQKAIGEAFAVELKNATGGDFFCGPTFDRNKADCPQIVFSIIDIDYADAGIQSARNEKQKQIELAAAALEKAKGEAAALLAEAKGKADAAAKIAELYKNPNWVRLQDTILKTQALIEACKAAKECKLIVGADGNLIMS